jgi:hypothetical protein
MVVLKGGGLKLTVSLLALAFAASSLLPGLAFAEPDNLSSDITSLNYYPHSGIFYANPSESSILYDQQTSNGADNASTSSNLFTLSLAVGLRKGLWFSIADSLLWDGNTSGGTVPGASSGLSNPSFTVGDRIIESENTGISLELRTKVAPSVGAQIPSNTSRYITGNNLSGSSSVSITPLLFWRNGKNELSLQTTANRNFIGQTNGVSAATTFSTEPYWTYSFTLADRIHIGKQFYLGGNVAYNISDRVIRDLANLAQTTITSSPFWSYSGHFGFRPDPFVVLQFSVTTSLSKTSALGATGIPTRTTDKRTTGQISFLHQFWFKNLAK